MQEIAISRPGRSISRFHKRLQDNHRTDFVGVTFYLAIFFLHPAGYHGLLRDGARKTFVYFMHRFVRKGTLQFHNKFSHQGRCLRIFIL